MIDSHCHLAAAEFATDRNAVIARAVSAGVTRMVTIADTLEEARQCIEIANEFSEVFCAVGVHPHHAATWRGEDTTTLKTLAQSSPRVRAIGEIGLDYHYDRSPRDVQEVVFREQLLLAKHLGLPAVIHSRDAADDMLRIIRDIEPPSIVIHCCTDAWADVREFVERGYMLSFTGIVTYPKSDVIRDTIRNCPLTQMMIETDAPFLAPVPHRGKRNEPAFVAEVAHAIAEIKGIGMQEVDEVTTENATRFFSLTP